MNKQINLCLCVTSFRNIGLFAKGTYKIVVELFHDSKNIDLFYSFNQKHRQETLESFPEMSVEGNCYSECESINHECDKFSSFKKKPINTFSTNDFKVKFHSQRVSLKEMCHFRTITKSQQLEIRISLMKKSQEEADKEYLCLKCISLNLKTDKQFLTFKQVFIPPFQSSSIQIIALYTSLLDFRQVTQMYLKEYDKLLEGTGKIEQVRKIIKRQRYEAFLLKKQIKQYLKNAVEDKIKLPAFFAEKMASMEEVDGSQILFLKYLAFYEKYNISLDMLSQELFHINCEKLASFKDFMNSFQEDFIILQKLKVKNINIARKKAKEFIISTERTLKTQELLYENSQNQYKLIKEKYRKILKCVQFKDLNYEKIRQMSFITDPQVIKNLKSFPLIEYPLIFRDIITIDRKRKKQDFLAVLLRKKTLRKKRFLIFAHGFQGLPVDLALLINMVKFHDQKVKVVVLKSYKGQMHQSIQKMASKIVFELKNYFDQVNFKEIEPEISFIGHSMGSILVRAAFAELPELCPYFHTFTSLCSPHLGYIQGTKFLTETGLSLLSKLFPIESLQELSNRDHQDLEKTFMYQLSKEGSLANFKRVVLISCTEDNYVPWHSARIQQYSQQGMKSKIQKQMIQNILGLKDMSKKLEVVQRIEVNFHEKQRYCVVDKQIQIFKLNDRKNLSYQASARQRLSGAFYQRHPI